MSSAFVKEDIDVPERSTRRRSSSGLPPDALNYITEAGAQRLRQRVEELKNAASDDPEISELENMLDSATIVKPPEGQEEVVFGVTVTLQSAAGELANYRIVGVEEVYLEPHNVSWVSTTGKALLGAKLGQRVRLEPKVQSKWTVVKIE